MDFELAAKFCRLSNNAVIRNNQELVRVFLMTGKVPVAYSRSVVWVKRKKKPQYVGKLKSDNVQRNILSS